MPNAATICCPANGVASMSSEHNHLIQTPLHHMLQLRARFCPTVLPGRITQELKARGWKVDRKRLQQLMQEDNLLPV